MLSRPILRAALLTAGRALPRRSFATSASPATSSSAAAPLYTAVVHTVGGRTGSSAGADGWKVQLSTPKSMGGPGTSGTVNPEVLFASGYSACFLGAMGLAAKTLKLQLPKETSIDAQVVLTKELTLQVQFDINGASDKEEMQRIVDEAHKLCPYSKATRNNIPVKLNVK